MTGASDAEIIALLKRYKCPTPVHDVRTRFDGDVRSDIDGFGDAPFWPPLDFRAKSAGSRTPVFSGDFGV